LQCVVVCHELSQIEEREKGRERGEREYVCVCVSVCV